MRIIDIYSKIANKELKNGQKFRIFFNDEIYRDFYYDGDEENEIQCLKNISDDYCLYDDIKLTDEVEMIESDEEPNYNPYCETCGTCGYIGCCGVRSFIDEHIKGKTNCKNEDLIISELIDLCEYKDKVFKQNKEAREFINNYDVFKEFSFPLMKRDEENQVKSSIDYQFKNDLKKKILEILGEKE